MSRYTGPKGRINRRLGALIYESNGASKALEKRNQPPGMHTRGRRPSNYGAALMEKQKIKHFYGLGERQLRRYFDNVSRSRGNTGELLLLLCERRFDNVVRRAGFTLTRPQARQGIVHGHFLINGKKVNKPSFILRPGDVISVKPKPALQEIYRNLLSQSMTEAMEWIGVDEGTLSCTIHGLPGPSDISLPVDVNTVVEFLSR